MDTALELPKPGGTSVAKSNKRKTSGGGAQPPAARPHIDRAAQAWSFVAGLEQDGTPAGACYSVWRGLHCNRKNCACTGMSRFRKTLHAGKVRRRRHLRNNNSSTSSSNLSKNSRRRRRHRSSRSSSSSSSSCSSNSSGRHHQRRSQNSTFRTGIKRRGGGTHGRSGAGGGRGAGNN